MNKSLIDTDILSELAKGRDSLLVAAARAYLQEHGRFAISAVTVMEVVRGYHLAGRADRLSEFIVSLSGLQVIPFTATTAQLAGKIDAELQRQGQPIGRADPMIAATAIEHALAIVTGNTDHFARVQRLGYPLAVENWREARR